MQLQRFTSRRRDWTACVLLFVSGYRSLSFFFSDTVVSLTSLLIFLTDMTLSNTNKTHLLLVLYFDKFQPEVSVFFTNKIHYRYILRSPS